MTRFVILATPRTGSNWLCTLLNSHPDILCHHEIFNPDGIHTALTVRATDLGFGTVDARDRDPLSVVDHVWRQTLGHPVVGFKINRGQNATALRHVLEDKGVKKIVIRRANAIRTYVSEQLAEMTGEWESYHGLDIGTAARSIIVDPAQLLEHARINQAFYDDALSILTPTGQSALEVRYEDLRAIETRRSLLQYLGVPSDVPLRSGTRKQNPAPLDSLVTNFDTLKEALRGTDLERDLLADEAAMHETEAAP